MAVHTKHPVSIPPAAPLREKTGHLLLRGWCVVVLFFGMSAVGWVNAFGAISTGVAGVASVMVSIIVWAALRPPLQVRRLPWYALGFVVWAGASLLWSQWPMATAMTWSLLAATTLQGLFIAAVLTWRELVRAIASALKWVLASSLVFELWVSLVVRAPVLPGFIPSTENTDPAEYWSQNTLFEAGRIQGYFGHANLLAPLALLGIIVFAIRLASNAPRKVLLGVWIAVSAFVFIRSGSATATVAAAAVAVVLITILLMRRAGAPGARTRFYLGFAVVAIGGLSALWVFRMPLLETLGRGADLAGREAIWASVAERAAEHPLIGWGYSTPWLAGVGRFDGWIVTHSESAIQAHNIWLDVSLQLGAVGVVMISLTYVAMVWRSWFFAVDRPRWDLRNDRPYSPLSLLPSLLGALLLVQGLAESTPLLLWGWMLLIALTAKIKQTPHIGVGPTEQTLAIERGERIVLAP